MRTEFTNNVENKVGLGGLFAVLTLTLSFIFCYTRFYQRKYHVNRRLLYNLLKDGRITLEFMGDCGLSYDKVDIYHFDYNNKKYEIWHYHLKKEFTLSEVKWHEETKFWHPVKFDLIGLFEGDISEKIICKRIMRYFKRGNNLNQLFNV